MGKLRKTDSWQLKRLVQPVRFGVTVDSISVFLRDKGKAVGKLTFFQKLEKAQQNFLQATDDRSKKNATKHIFADGLEVFIDDNGFMTAKTVDVAARMAGKTTAQKIEVLDTTLEAAAKALKP